MDGRSLDVGRIGPNAVTRLAEALGPERARAVFLAAGLSHRLSAPPTRMVPEGEVTALHRALRRLCSQAEVALASREAGERTARYLLDHRIPKAMQWLLRRLPADLAAQVLVGAIGRHAWTFAGSGRFRVIPGHPLRLEVAGGPIPRAGASPVPVCGYYAATFETLFRALVSPWACVSETACEATGARSCIFEVELRQRGAQSVAGPESG